MQFSLILATKGRTYEVQQFLRSLYNQINLGSEFDLELIIVDQNPDKRIYPLLKEYTHSFPIVYLHSPPGLSRARNLGLRHATGEIVAFPDDDCLYPNDLLMRIKKWFEANPKWDGLTVRSVAVNKKSSSAKWDVVPGALNFLNVWRRGISFTIFLRKEVTDAVGYFDEKLGVGAGTPWGSGEETDYLIRALKNGARLFYYPQLFVYHPDKELDIFRALRYGAGMGRVLRKHKYPIWYVVYLLSRPLGGALLSFLTVDIRKTRYYNAVFKGRLMGWLSVFESSDN